MWVTRNAVLLAAIGVTPLLASPDIFNRAGKCSATPYKSAIAIAFSFADGV